MKEEYLQEMYNERINKVNYMKNQITELPTPRPVQPNTDAMMLMIERVASNPEADIAKMERLMEMRNQELARVAKQAFSKDYVVMKPNLPTISKGKYNQQTKSKYAALEDINKAVDPVLAEYGFSTSTRVINQTDTSVTVEAVLWHREGHTETTQVMMPLDKAGIQGTVNKTGVHALASSITYAKRVAICALLNISTGDDKDGNRDAEDDVATAGQREAIGALFQKLRPEHQEKFTAGFGDVAFVKKRDVDKAMAKLNATLKGYEAK